MSDKPYGGRYTVLQHIGSGGMAEVYRARDELLDREVAVKVLSARLSGDRSFVERFRREAQAAANLNHPNIVSLYDYGSDDSTSYIVMEYIDGRSLSEVVASDGALMPERAAEIASDIAQALDRAHRAGIVHRDIKPGNVMITRTGQTKVTDFGIARALDQTGQHTVTQTGMVMGTAAYLSPEQAQGDRVDARSDIYSLGCVLYELLTGRAPFTGDTPLAIAYKHVREPASPPSRVNRDVPASLDAIVLKALAKDPNNRYQSAAEMHADLQRYLEGRKVLASPVAEGTTVATPMVTGTQAIPADAYEAEEEERKGLRYALIALLVLAVLGGLAWLLADQLFGPTVQVPRVTGRNLSQALDILRERGLDADVERRASNRPVDEVIEQDPEAGEEIEEGGTVSLVVSSGPRQVQVPDVIDLPFERARRVLRRADLEVGDTEQAASDAAEGTVIDQDPDAGDEVEAGTEVDLVVSSGPELVTVPFVEGQTQEDAEAEISGAGLSPVVQEQASDEVDEGHVIAQDPEGGAEVEPGSEVVIVVSTGPEAQEMPDVRGEDVDTAEQVLEDEYGLEVRREESDVPCEPGTVCEQDPEPGTPVEPGDQATLFVTEEGDGGPGPG